MKINRNSWHYRWSNFFTNQNTYNANLCSYFWKLLFSIFMPMLCTAIIGTTFILFLMKLFTEPGFINIVVITFCVVGCIFLPIWVIKYYKRITNYEEYRIPGEEVLIEFIKVKKRKICPLIKFY